MVVEVGMCDESISEAYVELNNGELGLEAAKRALDVATTSDMQVRIMWSSYHLGKAYLLLKQFEAAESALCNAQLHAQCGEGPDFKLLVGIEEAMIALFRQTDRSEIADSMEARLTTIREILG
jgi:hypothetical protein